MRISVEAEVCTVVERGPGRFHVLVKSAIWVLGFTTGSPPAEKTVVRVDGERPERDETREVHATVMANHKVGIAPHARGRYKYAELTGASWTASEKKLEDFWAEKRVRRAAPAAAPMDLPKKPPGR